MERQLGARFSVGRLVRPSWLSAPLHRTASLGIITGLPVLALFALRNIQVLEEDVKGTFWASAPGYALAHCDLCQRQRIIPVRKSDPAPMCSGGKIFHRHRPEEMRRFASGDDGFGAREPWRADARRSAK
jgi:hypothetical protein